LTTWTCDTCRDPVTDPNMSLVVWRTVADKSIDFMIVHKGECDPQARSGFTHNLELSSFLGADGATMLLSWLSLGPLRGSAADMPHVGNFDQYVDLFRRVQIPWYEEARTRFRDDDVQHWLGDANEYYPYMPDVLQQVVDRTLGSPVPRG
jgi:hypothetical protein